ncbi:MAG: pilus assembly protein TadG-related protein [Gemmatimonadota bacterium]|nr:pilus assembly protein TadG-related protein [Gemmatimonadota bacterium]
MQELPSAKSRRGAVAVLMAVLLTVLMIILAFAADLTQRYAYRQELQRAADAAAHAGAIQLGRPDFVSAYDTAVAYSQRNPVTGTTVTADTVEIGTWTHGLGFQPFGCHPPNCSLSDQGSANAIRVILKGTGGALFAQFAGDTGYAIRVEAIGIVERRVERTDCVKPIAVRYQDFIALLDSVRGIQGPLQDSLRPLDSADLRVLHTRSTDLRFCIVAGVSGQCTDPSRYRGTFLTVRGDPSLPVAETFAECWPSRVGPDSSLEVTAPPSVGDAQTFRDSWCARFGSQPCVMKVALWDSAAAPGARATSGLVCDGTLDENTGCVRIKLLAALVMDDTGPQDGIFDDGGTLAITGYFTMAVDNGMLAGPGFLSPLVRAVLAQ